MCYNTGAYPLPLFILNGDRVCQKTDASDYDLRCILSQFQRKQLHLVAFHSQKLNSAEQNYDIHNNELLTILVAFMEWKHYLEGTENPITVYTD